VRVNMAVAAGTALAALARYLERTRALSVGQGYLIALAACLPLTFPAYWDPPRMDRYFNWCLAPMKPKVEEYAAWVRNNTPGDAVFLAGNEACVWIPALAGRRVLESYPGWLWSYGIDYIQRELDIARIYKGVPETLDLLRQYHADYIMIGPNERSAFQPNVDYFNAHFRLVLHTQNYDIYAVH